MALVLALSYVQQNACGEWKITDSTGTYHVTSNPNGWQTSTSGGTNMRIDDSSVLTAVLTITKPDLTEYVFNLKTDAVWQALTPYTTGHAFDSSVTPDNLYYLLKASDLGGTIPDGAYQVRLELTDTTSSAQIGVVVGLYCIVECCVYKLVYQVPEKYYCTSCNDTFIRDTTVIWALYLALIYSARIASISRFNNILTTLQLACESYGCENCS